MLSLQPDDLGLEDWGFRGAVAGKGYAQSSRLGLAASGQAGM